MLHTTRRPADAGTPAIVAAAGPPPLHSLEDDTPLMTAGAGRWGGSWRASVGLPGRAGATAAALLAGLLLLAGLAVQRHPPIAGWLAVPALPVYALGAAAGTLSGFLFGLLGIGGALIVIPALYLMLPALGTAAAEVPHVAVATSLIVMVPTALRGAWTQYRRGGLDRAWLARLVPGVVAGAAAGALLAQHLNGTALSLLFVGQSVYYGWGLIKRRPSAPTSVRARLAVRCKQLPAGLIAPLAGSFCACVGMGGGSLLVPYLLTHGVDLVRATATSGALNLSIAAGGALGLAALQATPGGAAPVCWAAAAVIGLAGVLAVPLGVAATTRISTTTFRRVLGGVNLFGAAVLLGRTMFA